MFKRFVFVEIVLLLSCFSNLPAGTESNPCAIPVSNRAFWIPQFGHGMTGDLFFSTLTRIINLEEDTSTATVVTCSDSGQPLAMLRQDNGPQGVTALSELEVNIAGKGVANIPSFTLGGALRVGYGIVKTTDALGVEVLFDIRRDDGFFTSTNLRVGILHGGGSSATGTRDPAASLFAELGPGVNTGLAMLLPRDSNDPVPPVTVDLLFRDSNGQVQGTGQQVLQEGQKVAAFIDQFVAPQGSGPSGLQQPFSGSVDVLVSGEPCDPDSEFNPNLPCFVALVPLRQEEGLVLTTQLVFPPRRDRSDFPQGQGGLQNVAPPPSPPRTGVANPCALPALFAPDALYRAYFIAQFGHGSIPSANPANTLEFDTVVKFLNLADEEVEEGVFEAREAEFEIVTCSEEGEPLNMMAVPAGPQGHLTTSYITETIPPNGTFQINSLNDNPDSQIDVGYAIVRSLGFVVPEVIFNIRRGDGFLTSTNVPVLPILTATSFFADIDEATPLNTGIAFFFPSEFDTLGGDPPEPGVVRAMIELFLLDEQGEIVAETEFTVDRGHKTDDFLGQFFAGQLGDITQPFQGSLEIRASHPVAILPLRQEGLVLTTQALFPPRVLRNR